MLRIEAYIRPSSLPVFHAALVAAGVQGVTVWQTKGIGQQFHKADKPQMYRGAQVKDIYIDRVRIDTIIEDAQKDAVIQALTQTGEGKNLGTVQVFVSPVLEAIRVPNSK
jgi:nitrogen regulatory protein P-II 1